MVLKILVALAAQVGSMMMRNPTVGPRVVQSLSETWPIRRAARFTAYLYLRGKQALEDGAKDQIKISKSGVDGLSRFKDSFKQEVLKGAAEAKEDMKRRQRR